MFSSHSVSDFQCSCYCNAVVLLPFLSLVGVHFAASWCFSYWECSCKIVWSYFYLWCTHEGKICLFIDPFHHFDSLSSEDKSDNRFSIIFGIFFIKPGLCLDIAWTYIGVEPDFRNGDDFSVARSRVMSKKSVLDKFVCIVMLRTSDLKTACWLTSYSC